MENIGWSKIKTGVGYATHIPEAIKHLGSFLEEERHKAYWNIDNYVVVQSDLYEAAYYVIEPILELMEKEYTVNRLYPLRILTEIAIGGSSESIKTEKYGITTVGEACMRCLRDNRERIEKITVHDENEIEEKETLIEEIE
ncbi:hypothetical protein [Fluviicola sp.]|uniref:hypothetical protein n=1 Tax=Fluviicola sp. TaxID=1917219 RepID=UPI0031D478F5